jgi:hypothetical protein
LITPSTQTMYQVYGGRSWIWIIPLTITAVISVSAMAYFRSRSKYFAEEV